MGRYRSEGARFTVGIYRSGSSAALAQPDLATQRQGLSRLTQIITLVLVAAVLAMGAAMGAAIWQRRPRLAGMKVDGYSDVELWRALLCECSAAGSGCSIGALFGLYGQLAHSATHLRPSPASRLTSRSRYRSHSEPSLSRGGGCWRSWRSPDTSQRGQSRRCRANSALHPAFRRIQAIQDSRSGAARGAATVGASRGGGARLVWGLRGVAREVYCWKSRAAAIPDRALREDALVALARKRDNIDGAALLWILSPRRSQSLLRLLVGYEAMADFLDNANERAAGYGRDQRSPAPSRLSRPSIPLHRIPTTICTISGARTAATCTRLRACRMSCVGLPAYQQVQEVGTGSRSVAFRLLTTSPIRTVVNLHSGRGQRASVR